MEGTGFKDKRGSEIHYGDLLCFDNEDGAHVEYRVKDNDHVSQVVLERSSKYSSIKKPKDTCYHNA